MLTTLKIATIVAGLAMASTATAETIFVETVINDQLITLELKIDQIGQIVDPTGTGASQDGIEAVTCVARNIWGEVYAWRPLNQHESTWIGEPCMIDSFTGGWTE